MTAQEVEDWSLAKELIIEGLRPPIVHAITGLCRNRLRHLYREVHGIPAVQGRVSGYAYNRLRNKNQVMEGTTYYRVYRRLGGEQIITVLNPRLFLEAYRAYKAISFDIIDATTAWYIARDLTGLGQNVLEPRFCQACERDYLYDPRSDLMMRCPSCTG